MSNEEIVLEEKVSLKLAFLTSGFFSIVVFPIGLLKALIRSLANHFKITNERIVWTHGLFSQQDEEVELVRVKDTRFRQSLLERIFGVGWVEIASTDVSAPVIAIPLEKPKEWREKIRALVQTVKDKKGVRYEEHS